MRIDNQVFEWIFDNIKKGDPIIEFGSGEESTVILSEQYNLFSVEYNEAYLNKYKTTYIYAPLIEYKRSDGTMNKWFSALVLYKLLPTNYKLIFIDAPNNSRYRLGFLDYIALFITTVPFVFINSNKKYDKFMIDKIQKSFNKQKINLNCKDVTILI